jgi:hypothetical protein
MSQVIRMSALRSIHPKVVCADLNITNKKLRLDDKHRIAGYDDRVAFIETVLVHDCPVRNDPHVIS